MHAHEKIDFCDYIALSAHVCKYFVYAVFDNNWCHMI